MSKYRLIDKLGQGGMGAVFRAHDSQLDRDVAIKFLLEVAAQDKGLLKRWEREIKACFELAHPNIVKILDYGDADGKQYYVMELISGAKPMDKLIKEEKPLRIPRIKKLMDQLLDALEYCHGHKLIHRDIKPANIMVKTDDHVILMDFGLVKPQERTVVTQQGQVIGTPHYLAPELLRGKPASPQTDLFAAGGVFYELLTGRVCFRGGSVSEVARAVIRDPPAPVAAERPDAPQGTDELIEKFLAKDAAARVASAAEGRQLIAQWAGAYTPGNTARIRLQRSTASGKTMPSTVIPALPATPTAWAPPGKTLAAGAAGAALLVAALLAFAFHRSADSGRAPGAGQASQDAVLTSVHPSLEWSPVDVAAAWTSDHAYAAALEATPAATPAGASAGAGPVTTREASPTTDHRLTLTGLDPATPYTLRATAGAAASPAAVFEQSGRTGSLVELGKRLLQAFNAFDPWALLGREREEFQRIGTLRPSTQKERRQDAAKRWSDELSRRLDASALSSESARFEPQKDRYFHSLDVPLEDKIALAGRISEETELELVARWRAITMKPLSRRVSSKWYGIAESPLFEHPRAIAIEWEKRVREIQHCPPEDGPVHDAQDGQGELFIVYGETRPEERLAPALNQKMAPGLDALAPHWFSEPPLDLAFPPAGSIQWGQLYFLMEKFHPENPLRLFVKAPGAKTWRWIADVRSPKLGVQPVYYGIDPRLFVPGSRLRVELIYFIDANEPDQRGYFKTMSWQWMPREAAASPGPAAR